MIFHRKTSGNHGPAPFRRFNHEYAQGQSTDNSVSTGKEPWTRRMVHANLTHKSTSGIDDTVEQLVVLRRVPSGKPATKHDDRRPSASQCHAVHFRIDSSGTTRHDAAPRLDQPPRKPAGLSKTVGRTSTRSNDGHDRLLSRGQYTLNSKYARRIRNLNKRGRIFRMTKGDESA